MDVRLTVHRSAHEIGGNCIEIATGDHRIVLDVGRPLDAPNDATGLLPTTLDLKAPLDGVLTFVDQHGDAYDSTAEHRQAAFRFVRTRGDGLYIQNNVAIYR